MGFLFNLLRHPLTQGMDVDHPDTTVRRRSVIRGKPFLCRLYREWYDMVRQAIPGGAGDVVELGSGAGFMKEVISDLITTEVLPLEGIDVRIPSDGTLPFADRSLRAIVMTDVLHHIGDPRKFFREASRTVRAGGAIVMIEPWVTSWSKWVYAKLHSEPFRPDSAEWEFPDRGPLSAANGALPWIIFTRDRALFEREFPEWRVVRISPMMPVAYLLSGGVSMRSLCPGWAYGFCRFFERMLQRAGIRAAMFAWIVLERRPGSPEEPA